MTRLLTALLIALFATTGWAAPHESNKRPSNWNKHTNPRPGRLTTKARQKKGIFNPNKRSGRDAMKAFKMKSKT